jgi:hypothetical protein
VERVFERIVGALVRALLVGLIVTLPASLLPSLRPDAAQIVVLFAIFGALLTFIEYSARYPGLVEFRYAPPYNRIRFLSLATTVLLLGLMMRGQWVATPMTDFIAALGGMIGQWLDFPFSPLRLLLLTLPVSATLGEVALMRAAAGLSAAVALLTLGLFALSMWRSRWPAQHAAFNVWVNLPTFDPTAGGDVVARLERDGRTNFILGVLLPFVTPALVLAAGSVLTPLSQAGAQTQIWVIAAWAFLPACLLMRGMALNRIARMIRARREGAAAEAALQAV